MKKVAVLIADIFDENELVYPLYRLKEDFEVHLVGDEKDKVYKGKSGFEKTSTHAAKEIKADDYAGILIPGGYSPDKMRGSEALKHFVKDMDAQKKPIAAICHAGWMLTSCCEVEGKTLTSTPAIQDDMKHAGVNWVNEALAVDGHLITARMPDDMPGFVKEFVRQVEG